MSELEINNKYVLILSSGGIDSTACINFYLNINFRVELLFIDYGQLARSKEIKALKAIAQFYKINYKHITVKNNTHFNDGYIPGRNALLFFLGLMNFPKENGIISSGIHKGTNYYDCSKEFINQIQGIFDKYSQGTIKIEAPFLNFNKKDILNYCRIENVPLDLTYSCELGKKKPCGKCATCKDLKSIYASEK